MVRNFNFFRGYTSEFNLNLETRVVWGHTTTLSARWSRELEQDLVAFHNIDIEEELSAILSQEISNEIDRNIINSIAFPLIRNTFSGLLFNDLVSVQPMSMPVGNIFYLDYKKETILNTFKFGRKTLSL